MNSDIFRSKKIFSIMALSLIALLLPMAVMAEETSLATIEAAKSAIDQAEKAGAEQQAADDLSAAKLWLSQAEKAHAAANSMMSMISTAKMKKAREEEVLYLATMAKIKGLTAEAKAKKYSTAAKLKEAQRDLADYQSAAVVMKEKLRDAEKAKEVQAKAEAERKHLEESQRTADEIEAQKRKELEEARQKEASRVAAREKEAAEAKLKEAQLSTLRAKEMIEMKAKEETLSAEKEKLAVMQAKLHALEQEKAMLTAAGKIPKVAVKAGDKKIFMTISAIQLFNSANDLTSEGKEILDQVASFLKNYPDKKVVSQGHTDNKGKAAANQALSEKRAQRVREYLVSYQNISPNRITAEGMGATQPAATNASEAGRALNRRVELIISMGE
jgi:outer membrane protein OmpA-like peptidoglycan-associated protein